MFENVEASDGIVYKDHLIMAKPYFRTEFGNYAFTTTILGKNGNEQTYSDGNSFATHAEAVEAAVNLAKRIIDSDIVPKRPRESE